MHLDTHVVVWLYNGNAELFPAPARRRIEAEPVCISPMVALELQYLHETGRLDVASHVVVADLRGRIGLGVSETSFAQIVSVAPTLTWTRDPFDRLIVAHATAEAAPLLTRDRRIRAHYADAVWD